MMFAEYFGITRGDQDDWFDPILDVDTKLWIDPFMIFRESTGFWETAHPRIIDHFQTCFELLVQSGLRKNTLPYAKALALLTFKEPKEFCLGHTRDGTNGAGGGPGYARLIAEAMTEAVSRGLRDLSHFEELGILEKGIGPDRIADLTCNILKFKFIEYTKEVAERHHLETKVHCIENANYNARFRKWETEEHLLPTNPSNGRAVLLTPERFIRNRPVIDPKKWFEYYQVEMSRADFSYEIMTAVDKRTIVEAARRNLDSVRNWVEIQARESKSEPYDLNADRDGVYRWDAATRQHVQDSPIKLEAPQSLDAFFATIERIIAEYRRYIEEQRGWKLLWNDDKTEKLEEAAQLAFLGIARSYCAQNNIVVDREVELGRGPVDFKFSNGYQCRALLEVKKLHSGGFWKGLEKQLPSYLGSDDCKAGWYIAIQYRPEGISKVRGPQLPSVITHLREHSGKVVRFHLIDATPKISASNL